MKPLKGFSDCKGYYMSGVIKSNKLEKIFCNIAFATTSRSVFNKMIIKSEILAHLWGA